MIRPLVVKSWVTTIIFLIALVEAVQGEFIYVDAGSDGSGTGASWSVPLSDLQDALDLAEAGDEIWVAEGTYTPGASRSDAFQLKSGVAVYGGFVGTETERNQRNADPATNGTILSGEIGESIDSDNCYHVVNASGADSAVLAGFTLTKGWAGASSTDTSNDARGGAILINGGDSLFENLIVRDNVAYYVGGSVYMNNASPTFRNVRFLDSRTTGIGSAGVDNEGGGLYINQSDATFINCEFRDCQSFNGAGAALSLHGSDATLINCLLAENFTNHPTGGALYAVSASNLSLVNCTITGNRTQTSGGGIYQSGGSLTMTNCLFWNNLANNTTGSASASMELPGVSRNFRHCLVANWSASSLNTGDGFGNFNPADPLFMIPAQPATPQLADGDYRLQAGSPALNCGLDSVNAENFDAIGGLRLISNIDLGAIERQAIFVDVSAMGANDGSSWMDAFTDLQSALAIMQPTDVVQVAEGSYFPDIGPTQEEDSISERFNLLGDTELLGGFPAGGGLANDRDPATHETILSGFIGSGDPTSNSQFVIQVINQSDTVTLDGFTVEGAQSATLGEPFPNIRFSGAGLRAINSSTVIRNCLFRDNIANLSGGGAAFANSVFPTRIENCVFERNFAARGGAVSVFGSSVNITRSHFEGNEAEGAGAILIEGGSSVDIGDCRFVDNHARQLFATGSFDNGGAIDSGGENLSIDGCVFFRNTAQGAGGALYMPDGFLDIKNSSFVGNNAQGGSGGLDILGEIFGSIYNSIFWKNQRNDSASAATSSLRKSPLADLTGGSSLIEHYTATDLGGGTPGVFDGTAPANDPQFLSPASGNLRLALNSPMIDAGLNGEVITTEDIVGRERIQNGLVDLGAYEGGYAITFENVFPGLETDSDTNGNGRSNFLDYALGHNAKALNGPNALAYMDGKQPVFVFRSNAQDLRLRLQRSIDLVHWDDMKAGLDYTIDADVINESQTEAQVDLLDAVNHPPDGAMFFRLVFSSGIP
jgi:hypothetical protein